MNESREPVYAFGHFRLDVQARLLFAGDEVVTLTPNAFDIFSVERGEG